MAKWRCGQAMVSGDASQCKAVAEWLLMSS